MASEIQNVSSNIEIYLRMRPLLSGTASHYEIDKDERIVKWHVPRHVAAGMANHQKERYDFFFTDIFDTDSKQDEVFEKVARKVVMGALDGYNGTIFAYGQTGSGKTFSITGGAERYVDRGIIPRAISLIYSELGNRSDYTYTIHFSYLEIYNENGFDLLNPDHETKTLEDLPKVILLEDEENLIHLRNLSSHLATNEEEALNLLFVGDTNRMISATPMNMASSRSHCIFTATIEARKSGEDSVRKSKLHLVDLAGSERVSKTGVDGQILKEAKYINLSLHFLEQVIVALQERNQGKNRQHIPYRNSMMTSILRDSIGGNCQTVMLATVSIAQEQLEETISTCRFAQRVATISNRAVLNEEIDPNLVIRRLKQEIKDLKMEIQLLRGTSEEHTMNEMDLKSLQNQVYDFINDKSSEATLNFRANLQQIKTIFQLFKEVVLNERSTHVEAIDHDKSTSKEDTSALYGTIKDLSRQIQEKDNEINILVSFIRKHNQNNVQTDNSQKEIVKEVVCKEQTSSPSKDINDSDGNTLRKGERQHESVEESESDYCDKKAISSVPYVERSLSRAQAFEMFQKSYSRDQAIQENKFILKGKYQEAKSISEHVNKAKENINHLKSQIQKLRIERAMQDLHGRDQMETMVQNYEEDQLISQIETEKKLYKEGFNKLRDLKREIEHLHQLLEQNQRRLQEDLEKWLTLIERIECTSQNFVPEHPNFKQENTLSLSAAPQQLQEGEKNVYSRQQEDNNAKTLQSQMLERSWINL
ncbi:hypothetical protein KP509_35G000500 [Ceratopteris richardii]|uniref:Kinesin-like protein n=1 Tax=Ceratopteris richardii TaxID=49495 RepID=A0A8T2QE17_CERRI|nr:hypothetical protein KP509_35G000500 [Ceratopteris richardii]